MDEKLLRRVQATGAILIGIAYFLPWASIMSPLGSVELRGLYVDYAWILLVLAILHLLLQFARVEQRCAGTARLLAEVYRVSLADYALCLRCVLCVVWREFWFQCPQRLIRNTRDIFRVPQWIQW